MTSFDPEQFEDKYANYFPELQKAYKRAFERMNDQYDSELVHAIDQQILSESEPFYERGAEGGAADDSSGPDAGAHDGAFRIELPPDPIDRLDAVVVDEEKAEAVLERYVDELERQHRRVFGLE